MFVAVAAAECAMDVSDDVAVDAAAVTVAAFAADFPLCLSSMGSYFERIWSFLAAKRIHCAPLHNLLSGKKKEFTKNTSIFFAK